MTRRQARKEAQSRTPDLEQKPTSGPRGHRTPKAALTHTLSTRLQAGMTSRVNVTHAGDSRSAEAAVRYVLPLRGVVELGNARYSPHSLYGSGSCARRQSVPWSRPLGRGMGGAGQIFSGHAGSAHLATEPQRLSEAVRLKLI